MYYDLLADVANGLNYAFDFWITGLDTGVYDPKSFFYSKMNGKYKVLPEPYTGPSLDDNISYTYGYGALTSGHLDLTKSYKTFGTLGQGLAADQNTYDDSTTDLGVVASWKGEGVQHMVITFIPQSDNTDTSVTAKAKVMAKVISETVNATN